MKLFLGLLFDEIIRYNKGNKGKGVSLILNIETIFFERQEKQIAQFQNKSTVTKQELLVWLEEVKGSSRHIGLDTIAMHANSLIEELLHQNKEIWQEDEWSNLIQLFVLKLDEHKNKPINDTHTKEKITLLLFDNEVGSLDSRKQSLEKQGYEILVATNMNRTIRLFYDYRPNVILLDADKAEETVQKLVSRLSKRAFEAFIPIIVIGTKISDELQINLYDVGVTDLLDKAISEEVFPHLINNRLRQQKFLKATTLVDELTKAYNRTFLQQIWKQFFDDYRNRKINFSMALLDLDFFKQVNDTYGHAIGDEVLRSFSKCVLNNKRDQDYFFRYGGEEFILLMPEINQCEAVQQINQILDQFNRITHSSGNNNFSVSFTAGVCEMQPTIKTMRDLLEKSDQALYYGKENGKNRVEEYRQVVEQASIEVDKNTTFKIAVIDDDRFIRYFLEDRLSKIKANNYPIEVTTFADGETFLASDWRYQSGKKLILLDIILPKMDGLEVLSHLRRIVEQKNVSIMMLTGRRKNKDMIKALELGADDYITKPFTFEELEARIKRYADRLFGRE